MVRFAQQLNTNNDTRELALESYNELLDLLDFMFLPGVLLKQSECLLNLVKILIITVVESLGENESLKRKLKNNKLHINLQMTLTSKSALIATFSITLKRDRMQNGSLKIYFFYCPGNFFMEIFFFERGIILHP